MQRFAHALFVSVFLCSVPQLAAAQPISDDTLQLAHTLVYGNWEAMQKPIQAMESGLEEKLRNVGVTPDAAHLFGSEMQRAATREALAQAIAESLTADFTTEELQQIRIFVASPAGTKFQNFINHPATLSGYFAPIVKQACDSTLPQVNGSDRLVMSVGCRHIQTQIGQAQAGR
jgi:hypothetical protein